MAGRVGDVRAGACLEFDAVALLREVGGGLPANLDANIHQLAFCTVGNAVRALVQNAHGSRNLVGSLLERLAVLRVHDDERQVVCLRERKCR